MNLDKNHITAVGLELPAPIERAFFERDALEVAPELVGCRIVRVLPDGSARILTISETEAYLGESDSACHARHGRTKRNEPLYMRGGVFYVYLCYGIHWLLNAITGEEGRPQGVLIRACEGYPGPGRLTKALSITGEFTAKPVDGTPELWFAPREREFSVGTAERVGISYATPEDQARQWRFISKEA